MKKRKQFHQEGGKKKKKKSKKSSSSLHQKKNSNNDQKEQQQKDHQVPNKTLSLASQLKKQRGTASTTPLPPEWSKRNNCTRSFLTLDDDADNFLSCQKECYKGFCWDDPKDIPSSIHEDFQTTLNAMNDSGLFLYDIVQPGGKKCSFTFVTRTLIGDPGSTYKYLGLRLFSHPWCAVNDRFDKVCCERNNHNNMTQNIQNLVQLGYKTTCAKALIKMGYLNQELTKKTKEKLKSEIKPFLKDDQPVGSAEFTITLINKMDPTSVKKDLKNDIHGLGKTSVGWHKDSGVQDFSSIAVYHTFEPITDQHESKHIPWKVALRIADPNTSTPALSVTLPSGACYYLLDDFNHQHEHAVISGSDTLRYSSTHRVARDGSGTYQIIQEKSNHVMTTKLFSTLKDGIRDVLINNYNSMQLQKKLVKEVRLGLQLMHELEFEWIRMWNVQGQHHADLHAYWKKPIEQMKQTFLQLKQATSLIITELKNPNKGSVFLSEDLYDIMIEAIENREKQREIWTRRLQDKIFKTLPKLMQPIESGIFHNDEYDPTAKELREWRSIYTMTHQDQEVSSRNQKHSVSASKKGAMTKKEQKKVASNWQRMKSIIQKKK